MHLKVGPNKLSTGLWGSGCYVIICICLNDCLHGMLPTTFGHHSAFTALPGCRSRPRWKLEEVWGGGTTRPPALREKGVFFLFRWICLVCKAYLALLSFTKAFAFLIGCWNSSKQAWVKWRPSFSGTPSMIVMPNTWTKRSQDVNPGKQSVFAALLHDVDSNVIVSADCFGFTA